MNRLLNFSIALFLILLFFPFLLIVGVLVFVKLGRPIFYTQNRPGLYAKPFKMVKFRSMIDGDDLELHMRKNGDNRSDRLVKEEIFWEHIEPRFNVLAAFDDRPRIVRLWKDIGIPLVVDVCKTYEEF